MVLIGVMLHLMEARMCGHAVPCTVGEPIQALYFSEDRNSLRDERRWMTQRGVRHFFERWKRQETEDSK